MKAPQLAKYARPAAQKGCASYAQGLAPPFCAFPSKLFNLLFHLIPKKLNAAKKSLGELIEGTAEMVTMFEAVQQVSGELGIPLDVQILNECEQMFIAINRLLYDQQSKLKHLQMMQVAAETASKTVEQVRAQYARKADAQESTLFNQAV